MPDMYSVIAKQLGITRAEAKKRTLASAYGKLNDDAAEVMMRKVADENRKEADKMKPFETTEDKFSYHRWLEPIAQVDNIKVESKDVSYGASWKKRGGVGAFMMLARKWDRLEEILQRSYKYDIFDGIQADTSGKDGSVLAEVRDLRRYLLLVEAEMVERNPSLRP
jgi:hypothetical protein